MLAITKQTLTLLRIAQGQAGYHLRPPAARVKPRDLNRDRRRHLVDTTASLLRTGQPTHFAFEGASRHGIRSALCLEGWKWADADAAAADVVSAALRQIGAVRPTWNQAQPWWTEEGATATEHTHCQRCSRPLTAESVAGRFCSTLCASATHKERHRRSGEAMTRAERMAYIAAQRPAPKPCQHCGTVFLPRHGEARFCSPACAYASIRVRPIEATCAHCGTAFSPKKQVDQKFCSHACYTSSKPAARHPARPCVVCETMFTPAWPHAVYCSKLCQGRHDRAKKAAALPPRQCENCSTYFRSERPDARFCGTKCSAIARNRAIREASAFRCEAVK